MKIKIVIDEVFPAKEYGSEGKQLQEFVGHYMDGKYENKVVFTAFGQNVDKVSSLRKGEGAVVDFSPRSRAWSVNGKSGWSTSLTVNDLTIESNVSINQTQIDLEPVKADYNPMVSSGDDDDLPF